MSVQACETLRSWGPSLVVGSRRSSGGAVSSSVSVAVSAHSAKGNGSMTRWEYRLTAAGLCLRDHMTTLEDAPPLKMGGFSFYSPRSWVLADGSPVRWRR